MESLLHYQQYSGKKISFPNNTGLGWGGIARNCLTLPDYTSHLAQKSGMLGDDELFGEFH